MGHNWGEHAHNKEQFLVLNELFVDSKTDRAQRWTNSQNLTDWLILQITSPKHCWREEDESLLRRHTEDGHSPRVLLPIAHILYELIIFALKRRPRWDTEQLTAQIVMEGCAWRGPPACFYAHTTHCADSALTLIKWQTAVVMFESSLVLINKGGTILQ